MKRFHPLPIAALVLGLAGVAVSQPPASPLPAPQVSHTNEVVEVAVVPSVGVKAGATVALIGSNFGAEPGRVEIGCQEVQVTSWSPTRIQIILPATAPTPTAQGQPVMLTIFTSNPPLYYRSMAFKINAP